MYPTRRSDDTHVQLSETYPGISVSCDVSMFENCLVILHSTDIKKPLKVAHLRHGNRTVNMTVEGTEDFNVVVFIWTDSNGNQILNGDLAFFQNIKNLPSEFHTIVLGQ